MNKRWGLAAVPLAAAVLNAGVLAGVPRWVAQRAMHPIIAIKPAVGADGRAPGAFTKIWHLNHESDYLFDPGIVAFGAEGVRSRTPGPDSAGAPAERAFVITGLGRPYVWLNAFHEKVSEPGSLSLGNAQAGVLPTSLYAVAIPSGVRYQLSNTGLHWYFFNGTHWRPAGIHQQANSAEEVSVNIERFATEVGIGSLYVRAFLPGGTAPALEQIEIAGVAGSNDAHHQWD